MRIERRFFHVQLVECRARHALQSLKRGAVRLVRPRRKRHLLAGRQCLQFRVHRPVLLQHLRGVGLDLRVAGAFFGQFGGLHLEYAATRRGLQETGIGLGQVRRADRSRRDQQHRHRGQRRPHEFPCFLHCCLLARQRQQLPYLA
ncbi:hypothetical protein D3C87_1693370 [compost metagenome]